MQAGYSDFNNLMGFTSKKLPNTVIFLKMFVKKVFNQLNHYLRVGILGDSKTYHVLYL
jgi:hypothetical protein